MRHQDVPTHWRPDNIFFERRKYLPCTLYPPTVGSTGLDAYYFPGPFFALTTFRRNSGRVPKLDSKVRLDLDRVGEAVLIKPRWWAKSGPKPSTPGLLFCFTVHLARQRFQREACL